MELRIWRGQDRGSIPVPSVQGIPEPAINFVLKFALVADQNEIDRWRKYGLLDRKVGKWTTGSPVSLFGNSYSLVKEKSSGL
jgi:hypothetical protein